MRPRVPVTSSIAAVAVLALAGRPSAGNESLDGAHWDVGPGAAHGRPPAVLIVDATGDPRAQEALREFKAQWNAMRAAPSLAALPPVELVTGPRTEACSGTGVRGATHAGPQVVVCLDDGLATAAVGGPYRVDAHGHTVLGLVKLRAATLSWTPCNLRTAVAHELGHVMGLVHNDAHGLAGGASVMMSGKGPYGHGCPAWFNVHDRDALRALYERHAATCRAGSGARSAWSSRSGPSGPCCRSRTASPTDLRDGIVLPVSRGRRELLERRLAAPVAR